VNDIKCGRHPSKRALKRRRSLSVCLSVCRYYGVETAAVGFTIGLSIAVQTKEASADLMVVFIFGVLHSFVVYF
jgi:hypothetical protein